MPKMPKIKKQMYIQALLPFAAPDKEKHTFNMKKTPSWEDYAVELSKISNVPVDVLQDESTRSAKRQAYTRAVQRCIWQSSTYSVEALAQIEAFTKLNISGNTIKGTEVANKLSMSGMNAGDIDALMSSDDVKAARTIAAYEDIPESLPLAGTNSFGTDFENLW